MKPHALHVPLSDRERKAILKRSKKLGLTQGQYARKLMYGKLEPLEAVKRANLTDGTWIKVKCSDMRSPVTFKNSIDISMRKKERCKGTNKFGEPCGNMALKETEHCAAHSLRNEKGRKR